MAACHRLSQHGSHCVGLLPCMAAAARIAALVWCCGATFSAVTVSCPPTVHDCARWLESTPVQSVGTQCSLIMPWLVALEACCDV